MVLFLDFSLSFTVVFTHLWFLVNYVFVLWVARGHLYLWPTPLLAPVFNRGKTAPGGGRGSRSPSRVSLAGVPLHTLPVTIS